MKNLEMELTLKKNEKGRYFDLEYGQLFEKVGEFGLLQKQVGYYFDVIKGIRVEFDEWTQTMEVIAGDLCSDFETCGIY